MKILSTEQIEESTDLTDDLLRGPIPPLPTLRTHVRIISNRRRMSIAYLQKIFPPPPAPHDHQTILANSTPDPNSPLTVPRCALQLHA
jgi:hypothetical protein